MYILDKRSNKILQRQKSINITCNIIYIKIISLARYFNITCPYRKVEKRTRKFKSPHYLWARSIKGSLCWWKPAPCLRAVAQAEEVAVANVELRLVKTEARWGPEEKRHSSLASSPVPGAHVYSPFTTSKIKNTKNYV